MPFHPSRGCQSQLVRMEENISIIQASKAGGRAGLHLQGLKLTHIEMGERAIHVLIEGLKSDMMPCLRFLHLACRVDGSRIEQALEGSGRGKGSGKKGVNHLNFMAYIS